MKLPKGFHVGTLCINGHRYNRRKKSLRNKTGDCVICTRKFAATYYQKHKKKVKKNASIYRLNNKLAIKKRQQKWYQKNKQERKKKDRAYYEKNRVAILKRKKKGKAK